MQNARVREKAKAADSLSMTSILVTGGAGYIGSHTCKALRQAGLSPVTYDNLERGNREAVKWGELEIGDINDGAHLREVMARHRLAACVHFAALESVSKPGEALWGFYSGRTKGPENGRYGTSDGS